MSVKKYFSLTAVGLASLVATSAMAGGPDVMAPPAPIDNSGFYIDVGLGVGLSNWTDFDAGVMNSALPFNGAVTSSGSSGFSWGGDLGYQFNDYLSLEIGAYDLASVSGLTGLHINTLPNASNDDIKVSSWMLYVAGKISVPLAENFDVYGKAGIAWRFLNYSGHGADSTLGFVVPAGGTFVPVNAVVQDQHYANVLLGTGIQYWFTPNWSVHVQYLYVPAYTRFTWVSQQAPAVHLITAGAGYRFVS